MIYVLQKQVRAICNIGVRTRADGRKYADEQSSLARSLYKDGLDGRKERKRENPANFLQQQKNKQVFFYAEATL